MDSFEQLRRELAFEREIGVGPQEDYDAEDVSYVRNEFERLFNARPSLACLLKAVETQLTYPSLAPSPAPRRASWVRRLFTRKA